MPLQLDLLAGISGETPSTPDAPPPDIESARRQLEAIRSVTLDELRENVARISTSQLLIMLVSQALPLTEHEESLPPAELQMLVTAGLLAIADELDRRIPAREK